MVYLRLTDDLKKERNCCPGLDFDHMENFTDNCSIRISLSSLLLSACLIRKDCNVLTRTGIHIDNPVD